jgi:DNA-binding beta-propeller fold protein YncE
VAADSKGDVYFTENFGHRIRKIVRATGTMIGLAGNGLAGFSGDGGPAVQAQVNSPAGITVDSQGNIYFSDLENHRIRRIDGQTGIIDTIAGNGCDPFQTDCPLGDMGDAREASLNRPVDLQVRGTSLWIADSGNRRVRRLNLATGIIETVAGNGSGGSSGDGGPATSSAIGTPMGIALDASGHLFITDNLYHRIRRVDAGTGIITTVAGDQGPGFSGDNGPASTASFAFPRGVDVDDEGNLYIADTFNNRIRAIRGPQP